MADSTTPDIIYTKVDEAPELASASLLPIIRAFAGAAGVALGPQLLQDLPGARAQQPQHDLAVGEAGVVVRDLAQARLGVCGGKEVRERGGCVHESVSQQDTP